MRLTECKTCSGQGWYTPRFSPSVQINCDRCNPDCLPERELRRAYAALARLGEGTDV